MEEDLIAPCGMNCGICVSFLAMKYELHKHGFRKKYCAGCLPRGEHCTFMKNRCERLGNGQLRFCFECSDYPCQRLKDLDRRYREKYHMSMLANLKLIEEHGVAQLLEKEREKWRCPNCGGWICCHNGLCLNCELQTLQQNAKYRWGEE